jgi:hypothetical protein
MERRKARRLVVGEMVVMWSVRHAHRAGHDDEYPVYDDCREILALGLPRRPGRLEIVFRGGPGRSVPDGIGPSGVVSRPDGRWLNLHEPGTVRVLHDLAAARGWATPADTARVEVDGWLLFDRAAASRPSDGDR